jgi:NAD(P)-dependent dehydrogenase (short-subunit alcohol dehydrogenase family)
VVNDAGIDVDGTHASQEPAAETVNEIVGRGGTAVASFDDISERAAADALVDRTVDHFGRLDIILHNAGLSIGEFASIWAVNVGAAWWLAERAWPTMVANAYGRIVLTTSASGLYSDGSGPHENPKQAYSTSKAAIVGLTKSLAMRGAPANIKVNAISPKASTRLAALNRGITSTRSGAPTSSETLDWGRKYAPPDSVAAGALWLLHDSCPVSGRLFAIGAGRVAEIFVGVNRGYISTSDALQPEDVLTHLDEVFDRAEHYVPIDMLDHSTWTRVIIDGARSSSPDGRPPGLVARSR